MKSSRVHIKHLKPAFKDKRGLIFDLIEAPVEHVGMVTFSPDAIRGNHYHKKSIQYTYMLEGRIELLTKPARGRGRRVKKTIMEKGDLAVIPPGIIHTYRALTNASLIDCTSQSRRGSGYEDDTIRVETLR